MYVNWTYVTYTARFAIIITGEILFFKRKLVVSFQFSCNGIPSWKLELPELFLLDQGG